jgi:hypothetical protein
MDANAGLGCGCGLMTIVSRTLFLVAIITLTHLADRGAWAHGTQRQT